jgi:hypothetical protein
MNLGGNILAGGLLRQLRGGPMPSPRHLAMFYRTAFVLGAFQLILLAIGYAAPMLGWW